jgi:alkylhydroperoxidase family enzyme
MPPRVKPPADAPADDPIRGSALGHQPELTDAFMRAYGILWSRGVVDHPTKEMARLRNARVTDCGYCRNVRFDVAREQGLSEDVVDQIVDGYEQGGLDAKQKAVLRWTDAFLQQPGEPPEALRAELLEHFTPEQLVELTAGVALFMGFSKIAVSLGQAPADMPMMVIPTPDWAGADTPPEDPGGPVSSPTPDSASKPARFDADLASRMFSFRGKTDEGEGVDVSIIREHYHPEVRFQDAIQVVEGRDGVIEMMLRFPKRVAELSCTVHTALQQDDLIIVEWSMDMRAHKRLPVMTNHGMSKLRLDAEGRVIEHRDYFDLWGDMIDAFAGPSRLYRAIVRHME